MNDKDLIATLFELESLIRPGDIRSVLTEFGKELIRRFGFRWFRAEVPILNLEVRIPENAEFEDSVEFSGSVLRLHTGGRIDDLILKALRPLFERLDYTIAYSIFYDVMLNVLQFSEDLILLVDEEGRIVEMNRKAREIFGLREKLPEECRSEICEFGGRTYSMGGIKVGKLKVIVGRDITQIKRLEEAAREGEENFRRLAEAIPIAVVVYGKDGWLFMNKAVEELTGYTREDLISRQFREIVPENEREKLEKAIEAWVEGEDVGPYRLTVRRKDGRERRVIVRGASIKWKGKKAAIVTFTDVTEIEEDRERLKELSEMLSLINRILRHDVLNALTSALAYLEFYEDMKDESMLKKVRNSIERSVAIIKDMRAFEELVKKGELKLVDVRKVVEEVARKFDLDIRIRGSGRAFADDGLREVFENILQNAAQHSGSDRVDVTIKEFSDTCEIRIADYGKGIPNAIKDEIFKEGFKFGDTSRTGLGLHFVKKLVERYNGEVWVEDNIPKGAVFVIRLRK
ncbi:PAS domain S-box protein [Archaeoglobus neptunius]|uniref:PAS domain S-box protein n=1 Tax=Archaeoglobus neptunius TaxID=2798580 RepID=UPI0019288E38|nr:PAS domain-containing sensor histidine kinase [Archaeoglobus neptunius]